MNERSVHTLVLLTTLGLAAQVLAQEDSAVSAPVRVERATTPNMFLSIGALLLAPNSRHQPVPLFGYPIGNDGESLDQNEIDALIREARAGRVRLAIVTAHGGGESGEYEGRGIVNLDNASRQIQNMDDENLLALTRPLHGIEATEEFIADSSLWASR